MQLASAEVISELLNQQPAFPRSQRGLSTAPRIAGGRRRRCRCGECGECRENARWERIFTEKFADPNYYGLRVPAVVSPLSSI